MAIQTVKGAVWESKDNEIFLNVKDREFGAKGDGSTNDTAAIQAAIDSAESAGGGVVRIPSGTYIVLNPLVLPSKVALEGDLDVTSILKAGAGFSGTAIVKSKNFDSLTGSNTWFVSAGINFGFALNRLKIDGSLLNIRGVQLYGKKFYADQLFIFDCNNGGWYSEAGELVGQTETDDMPEADIGHIWVRRSGNNAGIGFEYNGPHDGKVEFLAVNGGVTGAKWGEIPATYAGLCDLMYGHVYAASGDGVIIESNIQVGTLISESNGGAGVILNKGNARISMLKLFNNSSASTVATLQVPSANNIISGAEVADRNGGGGVSITSDFNNITNLNISGGNTGALGLDVDGDNNHVSGFIRAYDGAGGTAIRTNNGGNRFDNYLNFAINACETGWNNVNTGERNSYDLRGNFLAGQTGFTGVRPNVDNNETVSYNFIVDTTRFNSYKSVLSQSIIDLNTTAVQSFVVPHGLWAQPFIDNVNFEMAIRTSVTTFEVAFFRVFSTDATNVTIQIKLRVATGTPGDVADLITQAWM